MEISADLGRGPATLPRASGQKLLTDDDRESVGIGFTDSGNFQRKLRKGWTRNGHLYVAEVSVGVALFDRRCQSGGHPCWPSDVMRMADAALRSAKAKGEEQIVFFDTDVAFKEQETLQLQNDLSTAIERGEMYLALQAQVHGDGTLAGAEALLRWRHTTLGEISPGRFIPLAEDSGEIVSIGHWVLTQALAVLASLQMHDPGLTMSVNISALQIQRGAFVDEVNHLLEETQVIPSGLILEITELRGVGYLMEHDIKE